MNARSNTAPASERKLSILLNRRLTGGLSLLASLPLEHAPWDPHPIAGLLFAAHILLFVAEQCEATPKRKGVGAESR